MNGQVSMLSMTGMLFSLIIALGMPIGALIFWKVKTEARVSSAFIGAGTFILFALVLEQTLHVIVLKTAGTTLTGNIWLYALYGGLCAGLFEETGRFLAMRFCMKKTLDTENGIMYGIGHGGIEAILILGIASVNNIANSIVINTGGMEKYIAPLQGEPREQALTIINALIETPSYGFFLGGIERISTFFLQICFSLLVYWAIKEQKAAWWFLAFGLHFAVDAGALILSRFISSVVLELLLLASVAGLVYLMWKREKHHILFLTP